MTQERDSLVTYLFQGKLEALKQSYNELCEALPKKDTNCKSVWETGSITQELLIVSRNLSFMLEIEERFKKSDKDFYSFLVGELALLSRNLLNSCDALTNAVETKNVELLAKFISNLGE